MWTCFWDMHSGGGQELQWSKIYIEAPEKEAISVFYRRFGFSPTRVSCTCCGEDYAYYSSEGCAQITGFHRECHYDETAKRYVEVPRTPDGGFLTIEEYVQLPDVHVIRAADITPEERATVVPKQGYVWVE